MNPMMKRRTLLGLALGAVGAGVAAPSMRAIGSIPNPFLFHSPAVQPFVDELPPIPVLRGTELTLDARTATHRFHRDFDPSASLAYGDMSYLGPTLEFQSGETSTLVMRNRMTGHPFGKDVDPSIHGADESDRTRPRAVLHLHGGVTPPQYDGHPFMTSEVGQEQLHLYPNEQAAATLWYHDHAMGITRLNVMAGLAGAVFMRDAFDTGLADNPLGLPSGEFEWPLVLQEKIFKASGEQSTRYTPLVPEGKWEGGATGDLGVVNGKVWPQLDVARGKYRFRLLNAGSFSAWNLYFSNGMRFWVIGNDGGLLNAPVETDSVKLSPGERVDIVVDFAGLSSGDTVELRNNEPAPFQAAILGMKLMPLFCRFRVGAATGFTAPLPTTLRGGIGQPAAIPQPGVAQNHRTVTVNQVLDSRFPPAMMTLNNLEFHDEDVERPRQGSTEIWSIANTTFDPHPVHLHLVNFRILDRQSLDLVGLRVAHPVPPVGQRWTPDVTPFLRGPLLPPYPWETGWKDTVMCPPQSVTRIVVRFPTEEELGFDPDAIFLGRDHHVSTPGAQTTYQGYVWHCHVLDHEDHEMMLPLRMVR